MSSPGNVHLQRATDQAGGLGSPSESDSDESTGEMKSYCGESGINLDHKRGNGEAADMEAVTFSSQFDSSSESLDSSMVN